MDQNIKCRTSNNKTPEQEKEKENKEKQHNNNKGKCEELIT